MQFATNPPGQQEEIIQLFTNTFSDSEGPPEGRLIGDLALDLLTITDPHDFFCFVAIENEQIVGSIFFSRLTFESHINAFLLAPVAVHTNYQGKSIGQKLINFGLNTLRDNGVELAFTYGDPNFYTKVGFRPISEKNIKAPLKLTYIQKAG